METWHSEPASVKIPVGANTAEQRRYRATSGDIREPCDPAIPRFCVHKEHCVQEEEMEREKLETNPNINQQENA